MSATSPPLGLLWGLDETLRNAIQVALALAAVELVLWTFTSHHLTEAVVYGVLGAVSTVLLGMRVAARNDQLQVADGELQVVRFGRVLTSLRLSQTSRISQRLRWGGSSSRHQGWRYCVDQPQRARVNVPFEFEEVLDATVEHLPRDLAEELESSLFHHRHRWTK